MLLVTRTANSSWASSFGSPSGQKCMTHTLGSVLSSVLRLPSAASVRAATDLSSARSIT